MRPIQVCLSISKELHDNYRGQGLDDQIFREAAEMLGRKLLEDGILEQHLEPDINRPEFHYILRLNRRDLPEPKPEPKPKAIVIRPAVNLQKELMGVSAEVKDAVMLLLKDGWSLKAPDSEREFDQRAVCAGLSSIPPKFKLEVKPEQPVEGLDAEIGRYWNRATGFQPSFAVLELKREDLAKVARHFAEWGAEHLK